LPIELLEKIADSIPEKIPEVVPVTYNDDSRPPSTIEAV
jgi:GMP synthase PP-ATPase subunit